MKYLKENNTGHSQGIVTKAQAEQAIEKAKDILPAPQARKLHVPTRNGDSVFMGNGVHLTKVRNPVNGPIKNRFVLVGLKPDIERLAVMAGI